MRKGIRATSAAAFVLVAMAVMALPAAASASPWSIFASHPHAVSMAFNSSRLLVVGGDSATTECTNVVTSYDSSGNSRTFAKLPDQPGCLGSELENAIAVVPQGDPAWSDGKAYVVHGAAIYALSSKGHVSKFVSGPCTDSSMPGITFDTVGTFRYQMIVTCDPGADVYTISPSGQKTHLASVPYFIEGPAVAPLSFPDYGGQLFLAGESDDTIYALSSAGVLSTVGTWSGSPEQVTFVPKTICSFGGGAFFSAVPPGKIYKRLASQFSGLNGSAIVSGENGSGVGVLSSPGAATPLDNDTSETYEGSTFFNYASGCH